MEQSRGLLDAVIASHLSGDDPSCLRGLRCQAELDRSDKPRYRDGHVLGRRWARPGGSYEHHVQRAAKSLITVDVGKAGRGSR